MAKSAGPLDICLLSPWHGGSHRRWVEGLQAHSRHRLNVFSLPDRHWKWRMHGAAITLAEQLAADGCDYDLFLANDMMDVAVFAALLRGRGVRAPIAVYFHENQLGYPLSPMDTDLSSGRDHHYGFLNYTSALAADRVYFNSHYHRDSFLAALPDFLAGFPDHRNPATVERIRQKSEVLPLGLNLSELEIYRPKRPAPAKRPLLLWNHRWEYDKDPEGFLRLLVRLRRRGIDFEVALLGERGRNAPPGLEEARRVLGSSIVMDGPVDDFGEYASWLWRAHILPVTSRQDFFGGSVVEAVYCGCHPWLPRRLAYPGHFPDQPVFYRDAADCLDGLEALIRSKSWCAPSPLADSMKQYDWSRLGPVYDQALLRLI